MEPAGILAPPLGPFEYFILVITSLQGSVSSPRTVNYGMQVHYCKAVEFRTSEIRLKSFWKKHFMGY